MMPMCAATLRMTTFSEKMVFETIAHAIPWGASLLPTRENSDGAVGNGLNRICSLLENAPLTNRKHLQGGASRVEGTYKLEVIEGPFGRWN